MPNPLLESILNNLLVNTPRDSFVGRMATSPPPQPMQLPLGGIPPAVLGAVMSPPPIPQGIQPQQPPMPQNIQQAPQTAPQTEQSAGKEKGKFDWGTLLKDLGIPVGAAIAGSVNPNLLPQASGLAAGYAQERSEQRKFEREKLGEDEVAIVDPENPDGDPQIIKVPKGSKVMSKRGDIGIDELLKADFKMPEEDSKKFKSIEDAEKANLPSGTRIIIDGREAIIE